MKINSKEVEFFAFSKYYQICLPVAISRILPTAFILKPAGKKNMNIHKYTNIQRKKIKTESIIFITVKTNEE